MDALRTQLLSIIDKIRANPLLTSLLPQAEALLEKVPTEVRVNRIPEFCLYIRDFEGQPGDLNYRNNNPGNLKYGPFAIANGSIGKDKKGFARFATMEAGTRALHKLVENAARGVSSIYKPTDTIVQFFQKYAPTNDGNAPEIYAKNVARRMKVDSSYQIKNLLG